MINIFLRRLIKPQPALSRIELLVALTILALLSTAGLKMFQSTQTSFVDGRTSLVKAKRNEAIAAAAITVNGVGHQMTRILNWGQPFQSMLPRIGRSAR